jgi:hypothetical protein
VIVVLPKLVNPTYRLLQKLGLDMATYQTTFEHQRLPLSAEFTDEAIELMKSSDAFVEYYHNYYKEGPHLENFREMIHHRLRRGEVVQEESSYHFEPGSDCSSLYPFLFSIIF